MLILWWTYLSVIFDSKGGVSLWKLCLMNHIDPINMAEGLTTILLILHTKLQKFNCQFWMAILWNEIWQSYMRCWNSVEKAGEWEHLFQPSFSVTIVKRAISLAVLPIRTEHYIYDRIYRQHFRTEMLRYKSQCNEINNIDESSNWEGKYTIEYMNVTFIRTAGEHWNTYLHSHT